MNTTGLFTRLRRLTALTGWLFGLVWRFRHLDHATPEAREQLLRQCSRKALDIIGVHIEENGGGHAHSGAIGRLVVANHVSWLDIMVVCALYPSAFIAMKEIRSWPIIGKVVANADAVFIDRSNRKDIDPINAAIAHKLAEGRNVCFYPEARTTLGNNILPLKAALFQAAIISGAPVQALALRYYDHRGQRTEAVSFAGRNLLQSVWRTLSLPAIRVRVDHAEPLWPQALPDADRFVLKEAVETFLRTHVLADSPHPERILPDDATQNIAN